MKYDEAMAAAEQAGTEWRNRQRPVWKKWAIGFGFSLIVLLLIFNIDGPVETYKRSEKETVSERAMRSEVVTGQEGCTARRPCSPEVLWDGSTKRTSIPDGKSICFDPSFWQNLARLGYTISYQDRPEHRYGCTRETVMNGSCNERAAHTFRFIPEKGVPIPEYWFVSMNATSC